MPHHIYVVEDHPVMREALAGLLVREPDLRLAGAAATAEDALLALEGIPCDLVVTDLRLPGQSGLDLIARLHETHPSLPVLVVSAQPEAVFADQARAAGAAGFLSKNRVAGRLAGTIREILGNPNREAA